MKPKQYVTNQAVLLSCCGKVSASNIIQMDFQKIFSLIPEPIVVFTPDFEILAATDAYLQVTMRSREELIGRHLLKSFPDNPNAEESRNEKLIRQSLENVLRTKKVDYLDVLRYDIPRPEAMGGGFDIRYWEASHTPLLNETGEVEAIVQRTSDVTEREMAKLALSESQEKYRFMAEAMPLLLFTLDEKNRLTYLNSRWERYTGHTLKELLHSGILQTIHPEDAPLFDNRLQEALLQSRELQIEIRVRAREGVYRWHLARILPQLDEAGKLTMWVGAITDIHSARQMVEELLEANTQMAQLSEHVQKAYNKAEAERMKFERLFMESPAFFCILRGPEHRFELINDNYQKLIPGKQVLDRTVAEAIPEVVDQGYIDILDNVYRTGQSFSANRTLVKLDRNNTGELEDVMLTFQYLPIYNEQHQVDGILVFGYEVSNLEA